MKRGKRLNEIISQAHQLMFVVLGFVQRMLVLILSMVGTVVSALCIGVPGLQTSSRGDEFVLSLQQMPGSPILYRV